MLTGDNTFQPAEDAAATAQSAVAMLARTNKAKRRKVSRNVKDDLRWVECVQRIRDAQDRAAFAEIFRHFAPRVKAFLMKSGTDAGMAEECAQDVMATLWHKSHLFDPARASVSTWVFTIARNRRIDMLRKQRRPEPDELTWGPEPEPEAADVMELQQESARLAEALAELPEKQRDLVQKAFFGDLSHSEIAAETGLPLGTIKSRIRLALERLRHAMK
ncbi:sigma-70 family RNA polymerase sigma factor [Litoreibacter ponti]